ncbi:uncharacterized protein LOC111324153 [Stylophora pistillata]|nr:uncharacterized protein LOC111324153 [Stylophora pistillata]XP_022783405.1 uncharacterized protein LOC111324153 [Stylophora pistillata]
MAHSLEITNDTLFGMKLNTLLINRGTAALRRVFDSYVPPPQLQTFLIGKEAVIRRLKREGKINKSQWDKLYPAPAVGTPASKYFDISLLYVLLRNVCRMPAPATGWGAKPAPTDRSVGAAVLKIHWYRNWYSHATIFEIDEASFQSSWKEIADAVQSLGEDPSRVENLRAAPLSVSICMERLAKFDFTGEVHFYTSKYHPGTREWVFSHVESWFQNRMSDSRVLIITGNAGMGKSVIVAQLCSNMKKRSVLGGMHFCQHNNQRRRKPELMVQSLARHLCDNLPGFKDILAGQLTCLNPTDLTTMNVEELFTHVLQEPSNMMADPGMNILLVVDAVDECEHQGRNELFDVISTQFHKLPSWIKFVVTGRTEQAMMDKLAHFNPFVLHPSDEKNEKDIKLFFEESLKNLVPKTSIEQNVNRLVSQAEGLMLYAHFVIKYVEDQKNTPTPSNLSSIFPRGITSVYEQYIDRLQMDLGVGKERFFDFLSSLVAARSPLPATMASRILGLCLDIDDGWSQFQKMSESISRLLPIRDGCIDVFHKSLVDWLSHPELYGKHRFTVKISEGNVVLSKECERTYSSIKERQDVPVEYSHEEKYALQHGTYHFTALPKLDESQKNRVFCHACRLELLYAKLQSKVCDVFSLIEELQNVKPFLKLSGDDSKEVSDCITCLRRHPYLLMENPNMIFQLLANDAETIAISLEACSVMSQTKYHHPLRLEVVNRSQTTDPVITKFRCKTYVNCCDVWIQGENTLLVCGCGEGFVHMFSVETGREHWKCQSDVIDIWQTEEERCNYCFLVPQHEVVLHGRFDKALTFTGESKVLFPENKHTFIDACISQDRKTMVTRETHVTNSLMIWELEGGELASKLELPTKSIACCALSLCEQYAISGSFDRGVSLWNLNVSDYNYQQNALGNKEPLTVDCLSGSEGNSQFVLLNSSKKQSLTFCELLANEFKSSEPRYINLGSTHRSLGVSSRGECLYVCGESRQLHCLGLPFAVRIALISKRTKWTYAKEVDTERVLLKDSDTVYMCRTLENKSSEEMAACGVMAISFSADGQHLYVLYKVGMSVYEASSGRWLRSNPSIQAKSFALSPSEDFILLQKGDRFELWGSDLQQRVKSLEHPTTPQRFVSYLDNDLVFFLSRSGQIQVWNLNESTFREIKGPKQSLIECCDIFVFKQEDDGVSHFRLLCCDRQSGLTLYDTVKANHIKQPVPEEEIVRCCKFSFDGRCIATGHIDGSLKLWDGRRLELKKRLSCGDSLVIGCGYLEQDLGDTVATVSESGTLRVWDAFSGSQLGSIKFESNICKIVASPVKAQVCIALEGKFVIVNGHRLEFD